MECRCFIEFKLLPSHIAVVFDECSLKAAITELTQLLGFFVLDSPLNTLPLYKELLSTENNNQLMITLFRNRRKRPLIMAYPKTMESDTGKATATHF